MYRWEPLPVAEPPQWLCRLLLAPKGKQREFAPVLADTGERLLRHVTRLREGNRNQGLFWAACRAGEQRLGGDVLEELVQAGVSIGLPAVEARRTVASAVRRARAAT